MHLGSIGLTPLWSQVAYIFAPRGKPRGNLFHYKIKNFIFMPENFQQTVDLREQMEKRREATRRSAKNPATPIEKIYSQTGADEPSSDLKKISRLKTARPSGGGYRWLTFFLAILVIAASFYFLFFSRWPGESADPKQKNWYAVKLADGEIFYGQIADVKADPVVIANVYYYYYHA